MTYLILNLSFLLTLFVLLNLFMRRSPWRAIALTALATLGLTVIFDNLIIGTGIVAYEQSKITGILIGQAPVEDFAYTIAAAVLIPSVWVLLRRKEKK